MKKATILVEPALVGREEELEELEHCLDSAIEGRGSTVLISGEAGCGKTRLVTEFISAAKKKRQVISVTGGCLSNAAVSYSPFIEAFSSFLSEKGGKGSGFEELEIDAWLSGAKQAEKSERYKNLAPQAWRDLTFAAVTKALSMMSAEQPVVFCIEDLHWADSASLALLHFAARALRSAKVLFLATYRSEELTTDEEGHGHPLAEELRLMRRENLFKEINLSNLSLNCVAEIARKMMGGAINAEFAAKLAEESRGNALFVTESLRLLCERGSLYQENDMWHLSLDTLGIPNKFKDIILRRLSLLKFNQRRVLDAASVIGEKFDVDLLSTVLGQDSLNVLEALNSIARSTSLLRVSESFFMFDHSKSRQAIYEEIALPLKKGYHRRVAEKLESSSKDGKLPFSEIAYHFAQAGDEVKAAKFALDAGRDALDRFSNAEAIKHFTYALEKVRDTPENAVMRRLALEGLGDAYFANCLYHKALDVFERLAVSEMGAVRLRAYRKAMDSALWLGNLSRLLELFKKAEPYAASNRLENARIHFLCVPALPPGANRIEAFEAALRVFEEEYSISDVARTLIPLSRGLSIYSMRTHEYGKVVSSFLRSIALYEELGDLRGLLDALFYSGESFVWYGVLKQEANDRLTRAVKIGERIGHYDKLAQALNYLAGIAESNGRLEEAISQTLKSIEYEKLTERDLEAYGQVFYAFLAMRYAKLGDLKRAEEYYGKIPFNQIEIPKVVTGATRDKIMYCTAIMRTQGVLFAAKNSWKKADKYFQKGIEVVKGSVAVSEILLRRDFIWALDRQGRTEEAKIQLEEIAKITRVAEEAFAHVVVEANLMAPRLVVAGEEFEIRLDLVNVSKKQGGLLKADGLVPPEFAVTALPVSDNLGNGSVEFGEKNINAFQVVTIKPKLKALKEGMFSLSPEIKYVDEKGTLKTSKPNPVNITVQPAEKTYEVLPNRVTTGFSELDVLLFGGIPEKFGVVLASPAIEERELLIRRFIKAGINAGEITFHLTVEAASTKVFAEENQANFYLVVCNPQAESIVKSLPNVYKLKGVENLTEIDIALTKAFRTLNPSVKGPRRICVEILSDVLLQHRALATRRWLSALLPTLKAKDFTVLAVVDPQMHPPEEVQAILGLFDGELRVTERETVKGAEKVLRIQKLSGQKYRGGERVLSRQKLEQ